MYYSVYFNDSFFDSLQVDFEDLTIDHQFNRGDKIILTDDFISSENYPAIKKLNEFSKLKKCNFDFIPENTKQIGEYSFVISDILFVPCIDESIFCRIYLDKL